MGGARQAWCPRCDELRAARPAAACPVCGRRLLAVPPARPGQPQPKRVDLARRRLRALLPAAGGLGVALLVLGVVASAFAAGRLTRTTPSGAAAAPSTSLPGFLDEGPETGRHDFNWQARDAGITVTLRTLTVGTGFSRLELHVLGVSRDHDISALQQLGVRDGNGRDLLGGGPIASISTASSRSSGRGGGIVVEVVLDRPLDPEAVAAVELGGMTLASHAQEQLHATLVDPELRRRLGDDQDDANWLSTRRDCPGCRLRVDCQACQTLRPVGWTYRRGHIVIAVEAVGRVEQTALNPSRRRVTVSDDNGFAEVSAWIDGSGDTAVISARAEQVTLAGDPGDDDDPIGYQVFIQSQAEAAVRGSWSIRRPGGSR